MRILYKNHVLRTTTDIDALTENPLHPFSTGLKNTALSRVSRTLDIDDQTIVFNFSSSMDVTYCAVISTNLTASATVTIEANSSDSWGSPAVTATALTRYAGDSYTLPDGTEIEKYDVWIVELSGSYQLTIRATQMIIYKSEAYFSGNMFRCPVWIPVKPSP
jgi:hypothetical protein